MILAMHFTQTNVAADKGSENMEEEELEEEAGNIT